VLAVLTVVLAIVPDPILLRDAAWLTGVLAVISGITYLWRGRFATKVTSRGIEARGYINHFVPWEDIAGVEVNGYGPADARLTESYTSTQYVRARTVGGGGRAVSRGSSGRLARLDTIRVVRARGRKLLLPAPRVAGWAADPDFDDKARQLQALCQQYGRSHGAGSA
jgi:Bacterial PH domain